jgi:hypothetical protein
MNLKFKPPFLDAKKMRVGDLVLYDPSKEGIGERAQGTIKEISRSFLALVLEDGTPIGVTRVYDHWHPPTIPQTPPAAAGAADAEPWFIRSEKDDILKKKIVSTPF